MDITQLKLGGYGFGVKTFYSSFHLGEDKRARYISISFPVELFNIKSSVGYQGGLTITGTDKLGFIHRFMHLSKVLKTGGIVERNTDFAITGNTGKNTTSAHLHWDIRKPGKTRIAYSNFVSPKEWVENILPNLIVMPERELSDWEKDAREWAIKNGVSNGERPLDPLTRVELWETLRKASLKK